MIANHEENRELDVRRLRESGIEVHVTRIETVPEAVETFEHLFDDVLGWERPDWLADGAGAAGAARCRRSPTRWRSRSGETRGWWWAASTFTGDLARRLGWANAFVDHEERYPKVEPAEIEAAGVDLVLLPDEPYVFTADDGPEAFPRTETRLVSGRLLTWYGPSLLEARSLGG